MSKLSRIDVTRLIEDPSGVTRAEAVTRIARDFARGVLGDSERQVAEEIFRVMAKDAEVRVRIALSRNLKDNPMVPRDVARTLAEDIDDVSLPMLQFSKALTDEDLVEIMYDQDEVTDKHIAIANRERVSERIADALVDTRNEDVVAQLVANREAEISENAFHKVVDGFGTSARIQQPMVVRDTLPVTIAERMVSMVSDTLRDRLVARGHAPEALVDAIVEQTRESATVDLIGATA